MFYGSGDKNANERSYCVIDMDSLCASMQFSCLLDYAYSLLTQSVWHAFKESSIVPERLGVVLEGRLSDQQLAAAIYAFIQGSCERYHCFALLIDFAKAHPENKLFKVDCLVKKNLSLVVVGMIIALWIEP